MKVHTRTFQSVYILVYASHFPSPWVCRFPWTATSWLAESILLPHCYVFAISPSRVLVTLLLPPSSFAMCPCSSFVLVPYACIIYPHFTSPPTTIPIPYPQYAAFSSTTPENPHPASSSPSSIISISIGDSLWKW